MEISAILKEFELLILNLQFYVALGTISMAVTTAWSIKRQSNIYKINDIRSRIDTFFIPFFETFTYQFANETEFQRKWDSVRPFIRNASKATQNAFFNNKFSSKVPKTMYNEGALSEKQEYSASDNFYKIAWNDFKKLDSKLMKLQKTKGTNLPETPGDHNFKLQRVP